MTFKDLLEQFSFDEIAPAFKTLWQRNAPEQAARCGNGMRRNRPHDLTWRAGEKSIIRYRR